MSFRSVRSICCLMLLLGVVTGEITDMDTGRRFRSRQEDELPCKQLWRGYEYMGRLQTIDENPYLCPSEDVKYSITKPLDGLPVALLVQGGGGCSLKEKVDMALNEISPNGVVRYLIIGYGRHPLGSGVEDFDEEIEDEESVLSELAAALLPDNLKNSLFSDDNLLSVSRHVDPHSGEVPLYILRVSERTASEILLDIIDKQSSEVKKLGGPRVSLDSRGNSLDGDTGALWLSLISLISACMCSFMLILNSNRWADAEEQARHAAQQRPTRRRLTRDQVRDLLPKYLYDAESHTLELIVEDGQAGMHAVKEIPKLPVQQEMDCCSICLDDYETGNKLRCLPCDHAFHSNCIGKWLSERSATCPLCKVEIMPEDEEDDDESEGDIHGTDDFNQNSYEGSGWWGRLFQAGASQSAYVASDDAGEVEGQNALTNNEPFETEFPRQSWWRRMFPSLSIPTIEVSVTEMLTEPLLPPETTAAAATSLEAPLEITAGSNECPDESTLRSDSDPAESSRQVSV